MDFPVVDGERDADHHSWAHYTGVAICEHVARTRADRPWMARIRDAEPRCLAVERERHAGVRPGSGDYPAAMALWLALHDLVGPRAIGAALNELDARDERLRVRGVRHYRFEELRDGRERTLRNPELARAAAELLPAQGATEPTALEPETPEGAAASRNQD